MVVWKDLNLRPADYESDELVQLMVETLGILRGFFMQISHSFQLRAQPEMRSFCSIENEPEFMSYLLGRVGDGGKCGRIEPDSNPNVYRNRGCLRWRVMG